MCGSQPGKRGEISIVFLLIWSWCQLVCLHCSVVVVATRNNNAGLGAGGPPSRAVFVQKQRLAPDASGDEGRELSYERSESEINVYSSMYVFVHVDLLRRLVAKCVVRTIPATVFYM